ncbi:MAG TPA: GTPase HflX [Bacteroidetes bacterium]|nr:GTPase HflX [Bacteroidota bacterium]
MACYPRNARANRSLCLSKKETESVREKAIIVGVSGVSGDRWETEEHLDELELLADTAGAEVMDRMVQERKKPDPAYYIGKGKAKLLAGLSSELKANLIIFDDDLSPAQTRNLEKLSGKKVIDRSALILDIFANRAKTREARTQVELAQLRYMLPRLTRQWTHLSRQVGGIGTRGPGETQLEVDRRLIRKRIDSLERDLVKIEKQRQQRRKHRQDVFKAALVGYTNVGKSTLLNALTESEVFVENRLFATLDATIRELKLSERDRVLLIDTVGFIRKLPHHLIASFKSTLEEAQEAELLIHVIDITNPVMDEQIETVQQVLTELKLNSKPTLFVFNKIDQVGNPNVIAALRERYKPAVFISAARGMFLNDFQQALLEYVREEDQELIYTVPAADGDVVAKIYRLAEVLDKKYEQDRVILRVLIRARHAAQLNALIQAKGYPVETLSRENIAGHA